MTVGSAWDSKVFWQPRRQTTFWDSQTTKRGYSSTIYSISVASPGILGAVLSYTNKRGVKVLESIWRRVTKLVTGLEGMSCGQRQRKDTWVAQSGEKETNEWPHYSLQVLEESASLFTLAITDRTCGKRTKLHQEKFRLDIRENFFTMKMIKHWNRISREMVDAPRLSVFKRHWDNVLNNML